MRQAVTSSLDCTIKFWDIGNGDNKNVINTYSKVYDMHINRSETSLVTGHNDYSIRVWNVKTRESMFKFEDAHSEPVCCVRYTPDEQYICSTSKDNSIKIWDIRQQKLMHTFEHAQFTLGSTKSKFTISANS